MTHKIYQYSIYRYISNKIRSALLAYYYGEVGKVQGKEENVHQLQWNMYSKWNKPRKMVIN